VVGILQNPSAFHIPDWMVNRRKDRVDGKTFHMVSNQVRAAAARRRAPPRRAPRRTRPHRPPPSRAAAPPTRTRRLRPRCARTSRR
jgi:hypothetical protein